MKKILPFIFCIVHMSISSQTTDVLTGSLNTPVRLLLNGNDLYVSHFNKITKIDLTNPVPVDVVSGVTQVTGMALDNNFLFFGLSNSNKIVKLDITDTLAIPIDVITGLNVPADLLLDGNILYYSEYSGNKISRIDITEAVPTPETLLSGLAAPDGLALLGNTLYYAEYSANKISKIDVNVVSPVPNVVVSSGLNQPSDLLLDGNILYIAEGGGGKISRGDISLMSTIVSDVVTGINNPIGILLDGNDLYIVENGVHKIVKFDLSTLSIEEIILINKVEVFPNPAIDVFEIETNIQIENVQILNINGQVVKTFASALDYYNISELDSGLYFAKIESSKGSITKKIIKQ